MTTPVYPPEPWYLGGSLLVSAYLVPHRDVPAELLEALPAGRRPIRVGGRTLIGVAFAQYVPGGVLAYNELLLAIPSRGRGGLRVTIPRIWVDSPISQAGGRELWGIPKELAQFERSDTPAAAIVSASVGVGLEARYGRSILPGLSPLPLPTLQVLNGQRIDAHNSVIGHVSWLHTKWGFASDGPLAFLLGRRPVTSVAIRDAVIIFGMKVERS